MTTLIESKDIDSVITFFEEKIELFRPFESVYLFGSILDPCCKMPNDIDLLLIYIEYTDKIIESCELIAMLLTSKLGLYVDLTILSIEEQQEIKFFDKIGLRCMKLK